MKKIVFKNKINWGWLPISVTLFLHALSIIYLILVIISDLSLVVLLSLFIYSLPLVILHIILLPITKSLVLKDYSNLTLYTTGIKIKNKLLSWKKIKSISFHTGSGKAFFREKRLPVLQKIYILDKKGKEYSCVIDIDYWLKHDREKNNLRQLKKLLVELNKGSIISDWAER